MVDRRLARPVLITMGGADLARSSYEATLYSRREVSEAVAVSPTR